MSQNFWKFVKLGTRPDVKVMSAKSGQDPLRFEKDTIKSKFYTEFKERWQASADPVESPPKTYMDQGRFGLELDREVTMSDRVGSRNTHPQKKNPPKKTQVGFFWVFLSQNKIMAVC